MLFDVDDDDLGEKSVFFHQRSLQLAHLLRTNQTDEFLQLYDSLPSEWTGELLEKAKTYIRDLQDLDSDRFASLHRKYFGEEYSSDSMSQPSPRILCPSAIKREQYQERSMANNRAYDEIHQLEKKSSSLSSTRTNIPVDSFVQMKLLCDTPTTETKFDESSFFNSFSSPRSRSSSSSSSSSSASSKLITPPTILPPSLPLTTSSTASNNCEHAKLLPNHGFDSHGSSTATKSSSDHSGSGRAGSDSDEPSTDRYIDYDHTTTSILKQRSNNPSKNYVDRIRSLPEQNTYQLIVPEKPSDNQQVDPTQLPTGQLPRFKLTASNDSNGQNEVKTRSPSSSQTNRQDSNHSASSRKSHARPIKKRKQSQQQDIIRTESIPGHRGDLDVEELILFIDGESSKKTSTNRPTDTNNKSKGSNNTRKSRKSSKTVPDINENVTRPLTPPTPVIDPSPPEILPPADQTSPEEIESIDTSTQSVNSENLSEPFVTVVHRRRVPKEHREETTVQIKDEPIIHPPVKRPSKSMPAVVFMSDRSVDIDLNGLSFGFDLDEPNDPPSSTPIMKEKALSPPPPPLPTPPPPPLSTTQTNTTALPSSQFIKHSYPPSASRFHFQPISPQYKEEDRYVQLSHSSSHIMSNALQLVYSEERRQHRSSDAFNLEQLTGYLALKWTDTIQRYEQGDDEILFVHE